MKDKVKMIVFVLVLGSLWAGVLVGVERATRPRIEAYQRAKVRMSVLAALGIDYADKDIDAVFKEHITEAEVTLDGKPRTLCRAKDGAVAFEIAGAGSQGPITGVLAVESDLKTVRGLKIVSNTETPGLGDRVLADEHLAGLRGKTLAPKLTVTRQGEAKAANEFDGITGATLTSRALQKLINDAMAKYAPVLGEGAAE